MTFTLQLQPFLIIKLKCLNRDKKYIYYVTVFNIYNSYYNSPLNLKIC